MSHETSHKSTKNNLNGVRSAVFSRSSFLKGLAASAVAAAGMGATSGSAMAATAGAQAAATAGSRSVFRHPFSSTSFWNTALGSAAVFESPSAAKTSSLLSGGCYINCEQWSIPVVNATTSDPTASVSTSPTWTWNYRVPSNAQVAIGTDGHSVITQPDAATAYENWTMKQVSATAWKSGFQVKTDLKGDGGTNGVRAAGVSALGGLIRAHEIQELRIPHALAIAIPRSKLKLGPVWPAKRQDGNASSTYSGPIPMGTLFGIPGNVNVAALPLSPEGRALAEALQNFGAYVVDAAGGTVLYAEPAAAGAAFNRMRNDFAAIRQYLRVVSNNSATAVGGGGTPRVPQAAQLL